MAHSAERLEQQGRSEDAMLLAQFGDRQANETTLPAVIRRLLNVQISNQNLLANLEEVENLRIRLKN
ncbi:MAG: hypothetical protein WAU00_21140, partial [Caldilinea sp.]